MRKQVEHEMLTIGHWTLQRESASDQLDPQWFVFGPIGIEPPEFSGEGAGSAYVW